ncbi:TetR/AcrR family transcriptional regulator [Mucilaginibacter sp. CAU 1740]|uniref:TetR/AcrR family transcriptional regulator n=1 Tax=Mucilaginibacter sp. CAU 1740 TaxID=3140365 RepID=UPI00325AFF59
MNILEKASELIYRKGYQATSIDEIIATTQVTKGAFFYHFKNKEEMGIAMVNDLMYPKLIPLMTKYLKQPGDIRARIYKMMKGILSNYEVFKVEFGCPVINLVEEMASLNKAFYKALSRVINTWREVLEIEILKAQDLGELSKDHNAGKIALHIITNYGGARNLGKVLGKSSYASFLGEFEKYLKQLA